MSDQVETKPDIESEPTVTDVTTPTEGPAAPVEGGEGGEQAAPKNNGRIVEATGPLPFDLEPHLISFLMENPFFAEISRWMRKVPTYSLPTAAVSYDTRSDDIVFYYNPDFMLKIYQTGGAEHGKNLLRAVFTHEFYHLIFNHVTSRRKTPHIVWNVATDLAINSIITTDHKLPLPVGCFIPGEVPGVPTGRTLTPEEEKAVGPVGLLVKSFEHGQSSEYYFEKLMDLKEELEKTMGAGYGLDDHDVWDEIPDNVRDIVNGKVKSIVGKAVRAADAKANGWGNMPASMREDIRASVTNVVDWRALLRQFAGYTYVAERSTTLKRVNKRYPYIHPGTKRRHMAKLAIAIDQSGSVDDHSLELLFGELNNLTRITSVTIIPFDTAVDEVDVFEWRRGQKMQARRVRCGGTDFNAPTDFVNHPKNKGKWDGVLICSDGECDAPKPSRIKRGYVIVPGRKLLFETKETVISMDQTKGNKYSGAWR